MKSGVGDWRVSEQRLAPVYSLLLNHPVSCLNYTQLACGKPERVTDQVLECLRKA